MPWLIALAVLCGVAAFPIAVRAVYCEFRPGVWFLLGPFRVKLYPRKAKAEKAKKKHNKASGAKGAAKQNEKKGANAHDFRPILQTLLAFLADLRTRLRVKNLQLKVVLAGDDPCDLAVNYGKAWAALSALTPQLERLLVIKKRRLEVACDFTSDTTCVYARIDIVIPFGWAAILLTRHGIQLLKQIIELKKTQKGGAKL